MSEAYAGIEVPKGSVSQLRTAGSRLIQKAGVLTDAATGLRTLSSTGGSWIGPAHGAYANRCISAATAAGLSAHAFIGAAGAAEAYADELEKAQHKAKQAIRDARDAQQRIDRAKEEIQKAQDRQRIASQRIDVAAHAQAIASIGGSPSGAADAMMQAAADELRDAQADERRWRDRLDEAEDDLRVAKRHGADAEEDARDAASTARTLFAAAGSAMPILSLPPPPAKPKDTRSGLEKAFDWGWDQVKAVPGAAKDSTVALGNQVAEAGEQTYNRFAHPELAWRYDMEQQAAFGHAVSHPLDTAKAVANWDDLSHGRIGAWIGGFAPDAAIAALTAGGGAAVRATRGTQRVGEMSGSAALRRADKNLDSATSATHGLDPRKTVGATARSRTMSGWIHEGAPGFDYVPPERVREMADRMDYRIRGAGASDQVAQGGFPGKYHASHAEAQHLAARAGQPIGVSRPMCDTCQSMFQHAADYTDQPLLVKDTQHSQLFLPGHDKPIVDPTPDQVPHGHGVRGEDLGRGAAAGAGAAGSSDHGR